MTYTIVVTDNGPDSVPSATLTDTLPTDITFVSASGQAMPTNGALTLPVGPLASGATTTLTVVVHPNAKGTLTNMVNVAATVPDPNSANNASSLDTAVNPVPPSADLVVTQSASPGAATVGRDDVAFTIEVTNHGPDPASDVTLTEALPAGAAFVSATGGVSPSRGALDFAIGNLASGASRTFTIVVRPGSAGTLTATATISAAEADPSMADNTAVASTDAVNPPSGVPTGSTGTPTPTTTPAAEPDGPRVIKVRRYGIHLMPTTIVLTFDEPLDPAAARDVKDYRITDRDGVRIAIRSAVYDAATRTVILHPSERISIHRPYTLRIPGTGPGGLSDPSSRLLDGRGTGRPGSDYVTHLTWRNLILPSWYHPPKGSVAKRR